MWGGWSSALVACDDTSDFFRYRARNRSFGDHLHYVIGWLAAATTTKTLINRAADADAAFQVRTRHSQLAPFAVEGGSI